LLKKIFGHNFNQKLIIGENERDMLDFINANNRLLILTAPIGWGKTVLLKYVWLYLMGQSEWLTKNVIPLYISVDQFETKFGDLTSSYDILNVAYKHVLRPRLMKMAFSFSSVDNENCWNYLRKSGGFEDLNYREEDLMKQYHNDRNKSILKRKIYDERSKSKICENFPYCIAKYVADIRGRLPILIFDNVDPMSIHVHKAMIQEANRLIEQYHLKIIISMRDITFNELADDPEGLIATYPMIRVKMENRDVQEYTKRRMNAAIQESKVEKFEYIDDGGKRLSFEQTKNLVDAIIELLMKEECSSLLDYLAYHNLRLLNILLKKYLMSGYIDIYRLIWAATEKVVTTESEYESPLWVLLSALITDNHQTFFSKERPDNRIQECIINLYCNNGKGLNEFFIRSHLLNFFERNRETSFFQVLEAYKKLYNVTPKNLQPAIEYAIRRLLECRLVVSSKYYRIRKKLNISDLDPLLLTDKGIYYRKIVATYFEYLIYMKDDVILPDNCDDIMDCVKESSRDGRYRELYKFLKLMYDQEKAFIKGLTLEQRIALKNNFSRYEDCNPYMVITPVEYMVKFGRERIINKDIVEQYEGLLKQIRNEIKAFLPDDAPTTDVT